MQVLKQHHNQIRSTSLNIISSFVRVIELRCLWRLMAAHPLGALEPPVALQLNRDFGCPPSVTSDRGEKTRRLGPLLVSQPGHCVGLALVWSRPLQGIPGVLVRSHHSEAKSFYATLDLLPEFFGVMLQAAASAAIAL